MLSRTISYFNSWFRRAPPQEPLPEIPNYTDDSDSFLEPMSDEMSVSSTH